MKLYRITKQLFLTDLSGEGAKLYGGRWNNIGSCMLYCSTHLSLCVLELLVHMDYSFVPKDFGFIELELPDNFKLTQVPKQLLKEDWRHNPPLPITQNFGTNWLKSNKTIGLKVPSAVLPNEFNVLLNPLFSDYQNIKITNKGHLDLDARTYLK